MQGIELGVYGVIHMLEEFKMQKFVLTVTNYIPLYVHIKFIIFDF